MSVALQGADIATASLFYKDATDVTLRTRMLLRFLDEEQRIDRNFEGKDMNWLLKFKLPVAQAYVRQQLSFSDDNYNLPATQTPVFWIDTSGMNFIEKTVNSGPTQIVDNYLVRADMLVTAMQIKLNKDLYSDNAINTTGVTGIITIFKQNLSNMICTTQDRIAVPASGTIIHGLTIAPGSNGGSWSNTLNVLQQMSSVLGSDWPDGQGSPDERYDCTTPRMYNENTNQWLNPGDVAQPGSWRQNCISMLSRSNTDLDQNSVKTMMPNIHVNGSGRMQDVKEALRLAYRDTQVSNRAAEMLGYYDVLNYEGAAIITDHECPANVTISFCAASMELLFYGDSGGDGGMRASEARKMSGSTGGGQEITGGIYTAFGPERIPGTVDWAWICIAGGNARYQPRWCTVHGNFVPNTNEA